MRELRSGLRRGRSATAAAIAAVREAEEKAERNQSSNGRMVIRIKLNKKNNTKQQPEPPPEVEHQEQQHSEPNKNPKATVIGLDNEEEEEENRELETRCFDEIREIGLNVVGDLVTEENSNSNIVEELDEGEEDQGYRTPDPYEEASEYLKQSAAAAALHTNEEVSAKKRCLEKGLLTQTPLHESSNSYEIYDDRRDGSVPLAAPECEVTNHNYEMYDHRHDGSVPVDIPACETTKDDVVAPVAVDEMRRTTRLSGKRKASGTSAEQPNLEDHPVEAPEEFKSDKLHEQRKSIENKWQEDKVSRLKVEDQLLKTENMVSWLEEALAKFMQNGKSPVSISNKHPLVNYGNLGKKLASLSTMLPSSNNEDLGVRPASTSIPVNNNRSSEKRPPLTSNRVYDKEKLGKGPASTSTRVPISNEENLGKGLASTANRVHLNNNENSGKGNASTSNRVHLNNNANLGKGAASNSNRVHLNNNANLEKRPASTSNRVQLNNNEKLGNSSSSFSDRANLNNYESSTSGRRNDNDDLPVVQENPSRHAARSVQVTPSRHVPTSVKDSNVSPIQRFYKSASQNLTGSIPFISVPVDAAVFGTDMELYLDLDDIRYMCHMEDLSENCVMAYIRHLYDKLMKRGIQHKFEFINPASVSAAKDADLSKLITTRLMNTNCEWVFVPVNPEGAHWLLVAINMVAMSCYWLDPSGLPTRFNIKPFITFGLKGLQKDGVRRSSPIWYNIKCPKQKSSVECGFYVMKFMREIIDEPNIFARSEPFPKSTYEQDEIDEVRLEWIQTVEAYI